MGLRDTAEQLEACQQQSVRDEATIIELQDLYRTANDDRAEAQRELDDARRQIAELEHDLARAESALADRLRHDAHAHPTATTIDRGALTTLTDELAGPDALDLHDLRYWVDRILALVQPVDGVLITPEQAQLAVRAARHSAESIRAVLDVDPGRLHPDVAGYVDRLTDLADHLQAHA
jgi:septal ring factor EnvC (AmiA/AmiB activator)